MIGAPTSRAVWQQDPPPPGSGTASPGLWMDELNCHVTGLAYDFAARRGRLDLPPLNRTRGDGVIELFKRIDPGVQRIYAISETPGYTTRYVLRAGEWETYCPQVPTE